MRTLANEIHDFFTSLEKKEEYSGSVLISKDENILFNRGYSFANREHQVKNTPENWIDNKAVYSDGYHNTSGAW